MKANCVVCGKEYEKRGRPVTCSETCRLQRRWGLYCCRYRDRTPKPKNPPFLYPCIVCGAVFIKRGNAKCCGGECKKTLARNGVQRRKAPPVTTVCVVCRKEFKKRGPAITCGLECRAKKTLAHDRARHGTHPLGLAWCVICGVEFKRIRGARTCSELCASMRTRARNIKKCSEYYAAHRDEVLECIRRFRVANLDAMREKDRHKHLARFLGITTFKLSAITIDKQLKGHDA